MDKRHILKTGEQTNKETNKNQDNWDLSQFFFFFFRSKRMGNSKNENISYRMMLLDSRKLSLRSISSAIYPLTTMDMFGSRGAFHVCSNLPKNCTPYIHSPSRLKKREWFVLLGADLRTLLFLFAIIAFLLRYLDWFSFYRDEKDSWVDWWDHWTVHRYYHEHLARIPVSKVVYLQTRANPSKTHLDSNACTQNVESSDG